MHPCHLWLFDCYQGVGFACAPCFGFGVFYGGESEVPMAPLGRVLIVVGVALVLLGFVLGYTNFFSYLKLGRLPGDVVLKRDNFRFFFPITTCIVLSLALTLIIYIVRKL
jgi:hypothetical protein